MTSQLHLYLLPTNPIAGVALSPPPLLKLTGKRRALHNDLESLKGKIRVYCRIMPRDVDVDASVTTPTTTPTPTTTTRTALTTTAGDRAVAVCVVDGPNTVEILPRHVEPEAANAIHALLLCQHPAIVLVELVEFVEDRKRFADLLMLMLLF